MATTSKVGRHAGLLCVAAALLSSTCADVACGCTFYVTDWQATLAGTNHVPPVTTSAAATASLHLNSGTQVAYTITITTLPATPITAATLHQGAHTANTTPVAVELCGPGGTAPACASLTAPGVLVANTATFSAAQVTAMRAYFMYAIVRTTGNPDGEMRGVLRNVVP